MTYGAQLLSLSMEKLPLPKSSIPYSDLSILIPIKDIHTYEYELKKLAQKLPYGTKSWPSFGQYVEDRCRVVVNEFQHQLEYCERGSYRIINNCENIIDLSYQILNIAFPSLTPSALKVANSLDQTIDQRLILWLGMSSEIFYMYTVNKYFGIRMLNANVTWMCEELVRMEVFENPFTALHSEKYIVQGLMLSGLPQIMASKIYKELLNE